MDDHSVDDQHHATLMMEILSLGCDLLKSYVKMTNQVMKVKKNNYNNNLFVGAEESELKSASHFLLISQHSSWSSCEAKLSEYCHQHERVRSHHVPMICWTWDLSLPFRKVYDCHSPGFPCVLLGDLIFSLNFSYTFHSSQQAIQACSDIEHNLRSHRCKDVCLLDCSSCFLTPKYRYLSLALTGPILFSFEYMCRGVIMASTTAASPHSIHYRHLAFIAI